MQRVSVSLSDQVARAVERAAAAEHRSVSQWVALAVGAAISRAAFLPEVAERGSVAEEVSEVPEEKPRFAEVRPVSEFLAERFNAASEFKPDPKPGKK